MSISCKPDPIAPPDEVQAREARHPKSKPGQVQNDWRARSFDEILGMLSPNLQTGRLRMRGLSPLPLQSKSCKAFERFEDAYHALEQERLITKSPLPFEDCQKNFRKWLVYRLVWSFERPWEQKRTSGLLFRHLPGSARVYLNREYLGELGELRETSMQIRKSPRFLAPAPSYLEIPSGSLRQTNELRLLVESGHYPRPDLGEVFFGSLEAFYLQERRRDSWLGFLFGITLIASLFNLFFYMLNRRPTHLVASLIPGLLCLHELVHLPVGWSGYPSVFHGFDTGILYAAVPMLVFVFYTKLYMTVLQPKKKQRVWLGFRSWARYFLRGILRAYILLSGSAVFLYLGLSQSPARFQKWLPGFFYIYTLPALCCVLLLLGMAIYERRPAALVAFGATLMLASALLADAHARIYDPVPRLGTAPFAMLLFIFQFILILALNRYRTLQESHRSRKLLQLSNRKLKENDLLKNQYILASSRELLSGLEALAKETLTLLDKTELRLPKVAMVALSQILHGLRNFQKRLRRVEFLFDELEHQEPDLRATNLPEVLDLFSLTVEPEYPDLELSIEVEPELPEIRANKEMLSELLHELLENTLMHSPKPQVRIRAFRHKNKVELSWQDPGLARKARRLKNFLKPFQKEEPRAKQAGVGLSLVYRISELHGEPMQISETGELRFRFEYNEGIYQDSKRRLAILHIAFLYRTGRADQAWREIIALEGQKPFYWLASRYRKADGIYRYLAAYEKILKQPLADMYTSSHGSFLDESWDDPEWEEDPL